jgi:nucleoid-associated protein YgaU
MPRPPAATTIVDTILKRLHEEIGFFLSPGDSPSHRRFRDGCIRDVKMLMRGEVEVEVETVRYYRVREGDTLSEIAEWFNVGLPALCEANSIRNADMIHPGDRLRLPEGARR